MHMEHIHSHLYDECDQDARTNETHLRIILQLCLTKYLIDPFLTTVWDHKDGCAEDYHFESAIYLLSCRDVEFPINIYR